MDNTKIYIREIDVEDWKWIKCLGIILKWQATVLAVLNLPSFASRSSQL
jgi:hypothetical protein